MNTSQEQLIKLLINNAKPVWEIEAVHKRCLIYYGEERALKECQDIIDFAQAANIGLLESFRLQVEICQLSVES